MVHDIADAMDQLDDELGHGIPWRGLPAENHGAGHGVNDNTFSDAVIACDNLEHVQELPLVFVNALDLNVEHRVGIDLDLESHHNDFSKALFVCPLHLTELLPKLGLGGKRSKFFELLKVTVPVGADGHGNEGRQAGVCLVEPSPRRHSIRDIDDLPGRKPVENP